VEQRQRQEEKEKLVDYDVTQVDDRIKDACYALMQGVEREDEYFRLEQMREFKKNNLFWHGFQYLFWSDTDMDWRIPTHQEWTEISGREETRYIFDYVVNHFKAHGEAIIAALSADIPNVRFGPRNSQDPEDRRSVSAADSCAELIEKWNRAKLLIIEALFYLCCEGFVASYTYNRKDESYGTIPIPQYDTRPEKVTPDMHVCPACGNSQPVDTGAAPTGGMDTSELGGLVPTQFQQDIGASSVGDMPSAQENQNSPGGEEDSEEPDNLGGQSGLGNPVCSCGEQMELQPGQMEQVPFITGERLIPKGREVIEVYGPLNVRVPSYVTKLADAGYLIHYVDADPALFQGTFPQVADKIEADPGQDYERLMRQSSLSLDGYQLNIKLATEKKCWFRPWMLNRLRPVYDDIIPDLQQMFPDGIYTSYIGQTMCELRNESVDKHWSVTKAGPSKGIHADPILKPEVPLQEITNNLFNLFVMQVEYGVGATYADTEVFDFEGQSKQEVSPGYIYPVNPRPGQSIGDAFYTERGASLNKESTELLATVANNEQFVLGSYPSIYGGPQQSGSKTLGEYDKSRAFALQRLGLVYYFIDVWWGETVHKSVLSFIEHQLEDEPLTLNSPGGFQTRWIKKADFKGSFDRLDPDPSADFPISFAQKRQTLMALFQLNNPVINSALLAPENAELIQQYIGLDEIRIPSADQRNKQIGEILILIGMEPQIGMDGNPIATVPVEPEIDDHAVHIAVLTDFLVSDQGQDLKQENMAAYSNCMAHLLEHKKFQQIAMMQQMALQGPPKGGPQSPKKQPKPVGPPPPEAQAQGVPS